MSEKGDKFGKIFYNAADESIKMIELECRIANQRKSFVSDADKENSSMMNTQRKPWMDANQDLKNLLKKSSSDLQRHTANRRRSHERS